MSEDQKATITTQTTTAVVGAYESQIIDRATALKELRQLSAITGAFSNVTDEDIQQAIDEPPPEMSETPPPEVPTEKNDNAQTDA